MLHAPHDVHVGGSSHNRVPGLSDCLKRRSTEPIDRGASGSQRQPCHQADAPGHIASQFTSLLRGSEDNIFNRVGIDAGAVNRSPDHGHGQFIATDIAKDPLERM